MTIFLVKKMSGIVATPLLNKPLEIELIGVYLFLGICPMYFMALPV